MGKYRTFPKKVARFGDILDPNKGNDGQSAKWPGNFLPLFRKQCGPAKFEKSSGYNLCSIANLRLILWVIIGNCILQNCFASPIETTGVHTKSVKTEADTQNLIEFETTFEEPSPRFLAAIPQNCTPSSSDEFPADLFTKTQRQHGAIILHFVALLYLLYSLLLVCDVYFVPAIECICQKLQIAPNIAGATFMAISTSAPELFTNVIGTFITKDGLGIGTVLGSAVFNVLAVGTCVGIGTNIAVKSMSTGSRNQHKGVHLEWWSLSRDTAYYLLSVLILIGVLFDGRVYWYETVGMMAVYGLYIAGMCYDAQCREFAETLYEKIRNLFTCNDGTQKKSSVYKQTFDNDTSPLICGVPNGGNYGTEDLNGQTKSSAKKVSLGEVLSGPGSNNTFDEHSVSSDSSRSSNMTLASPVALLHGLKDILAFPVRLALRFTIPNCRQERMKKWCGISLLCCVAWIGGLSYVISWMVCIIGETFEIPDTVSGLTFLAAGTSLPEVLSSVIVARQGLGTMGLSNSIGSNTFDILICLGLPWTIQSLILTSKDDNFIAIHSAGMEYSAALLVTSMIILYVILVMNNYVLDTKVGVSCLAMYIVFITVACLLEMNVFFPVNLPPCKLPLE